SDVRCAARIINFGHVAHGVVEVGGVPLGYAPAVGEPAVGVVFIAENFDAGLVELVCHAAKLVVIPCGQLGLAIGERLQIAGRIVAVAEYFGVGIRLRHFAAGFVVAVTGHLVELIGVFGQTARRVAEPLHA